MTERIEEILRTIEGRLFERGIEAQRTWRPLTNSLVWGDTGWMLEGKGWRLYSYIDRKTNERYLSIGHDDLSHVNLQKPLSDPACLDEVATAIQSLPRPLAV